MFSPLKKHIWPFLVVLIIFTFLSCDGRDRTFKTNAEVLTELNLLEGFEETLNVVPEHPIKIITDTILSSGFKVRIDYHSLKNNHILNLAKSHSSANIKTYYGNFEAQVNILKDDKYCTDFIVNKAFFKDFESPLFWKHAIMQYVWIDYETSTNNSIYLNTTFRTLNTQTYKDFVIQIDNEGVIQIKERNISAKTI